MFTSKVTKSLREEKKGVKIVEVLNLYRILVTVHYQINRRTNERGTVF